MKTILEKVPYDRSRDSGTAQVLERDHFDETRMPRLPLPVLAESAIVAAHNSNVQIPVKVLLDTGTDITLVNPAVVNALNSMLGGDSGDPIQLSRKINFFNSPGTSFENAYKLGIVLGGYKYFSIFGFIAPRNWDFEDMDVWMGQDILQQLVVTFDGPERTITAMDPKLR